MEMLVACFMGLVAGAVIAIKATKHRWVSADTLREAHWAQDEQRRWEIRTGRQFSMDEVSQLRARS
jgi:hypothetical protein